MEVVKETFPECVEQHMNGIQCKTYIDEEILKTFTGDDRMTRTVLVEKRSILDIFYNSVVIPMDDDDIVLVSFGEMWPAAWFMANVHVTGPIYICFLIWLLQGRDGDGLVYYDL